MLKVHAYNTLFSCISLLLCLIRQSGVWLCMFFVYSSIYEECLHCKIKFWWHQNPQPRRLHPFENCALTYQVVALKRAIGFWWRRAGYLEQVYSVPSDTACLASSQTNQPKLAKFPVGVLKKAPDWNMKVPNTVEQGIPNFKCPNLISR